MKSKIILNDEQIYLRTLMESDASQDYLNWLSNPLINRYLETRFAPPETLIELKKFISECEGSLNILLMGIFLKEDNRHIGNIKLGPINQHHKTADVGFLIGDKNEWGKNYASRAILLFTDYGFAELNIDKFTAGAVKQNIASQKALVKAGFTHEGTLKSQSLIDGVRQDGFVYGKLSGLPRLY